MPPGSPVPATSALHRTTSALDRIWIDAAARLQIPVVRGGEAYVHFDGIRLHIATDEHLDADDTVAQLVLHELCHWVVQGLEARALPDWGLDNTSDRDAGRELACVRLQAHLTSAHGLRHRLFPTTPVRAFFESLPADALLGDDEPARLARVAALRAAREPFRAVLMEALAASARLEPGPLHPKSGFLVRAGSERCGGCAWRAPSGLCRQAAPARRFVAVEELACVRWEGVLDCLACGACCRSAYDSVTLGRRDPAARAHPELVVDRGSYLELRREGDRCAALGGAQGGPFSCGIYAERPRSCRDFERGGRHCLDARKRVGLSS